MPAIRILSKSRTTGVPSVTGQPYPPSARRKKRSSPTRGKDSRKCVARTGNLHRRARFIATAAACPNAAKAGECSSPSSCRLMAACVAAAYTPKQGRLGWWLPCVEAGTASPAWSLSLSGQKRVVLGHAPARSSACGRLGHPQAQVGSHGKIGGDQQRARGGGKGGDSGTGGALRGRGCKGSGAPHPGARARRCALQHRRARLSFSRGVDSVPGVAGPFSSSEDLAFRKGLKVAWRDA